MFSIVVTTHYILEVPHQKVKNIAFGLLSLAVFFIDILTTELSGNEISSKLMIKGINLSIPELIFIIVIFYTLVIGVICYKKMKNKIIQKIVKYIVPIVAVFMPLIIIDNLRSYLEPFYLFPILYSIFGILITNFFSKYYIRKLNILKNSSVDEDFLNKHQISAREKEIIQLLLKGYSNKKICEKLFISMNTIKTHNKNIYSKLGINSRFELISMLKEK